MDRKLVNAFAQELHLNARNLTDILFYEILMYKFNFGVHYKTVTMNRLKIDSIIPVFEHFEYSYPS